jgi:hypothetical protein
LLEVVTSLIGATETNSTPHSLERADLSAL